MCLSEDLSTKDFILAETHLAAAKIYCRDRLPFSNEFAKFHLEHAAELDSIEALDYLWRRKLGLPLKFQELQRIEIERNESDGWEKLETAANLGDVPASLQLGKFLFFGITINMQEKKNWQRADKIFENC